MISFLLCSLILPYLIATCVKKGSQKSEVSRRLPVSPVPSISNSAPIASESEPSEDSKSEKSFKKSKNSATDSLKVPRPNLSNSGKSGKSGKSSKSGKSERSDTDSAKTEVINVPLGKAAIDVPAVNILTPASEHKVASISIRTQRVSFAESLKRVRRRGTRPEDSEDEKTKYIA
ncbi:unnamed protein product [Caenorhabditis sp. 36 PRJEB53466]|nr:unnamed protein product [Caenorhabditis sp. 36 PRJEB53466]